MMGAAFEHFLRRGQAEMALVHRQLPLASHHADDLQVGIGLDGVTEFQFLPRAPHLVENNAGDQHLGIEILIAEQQRRHAARHAQCVDHQHHRRAEQFCQRRAGIAAQRVDAVVQALVAFDQRQIGVDRRAGAERDDLLVRLGVEIEIVAGPSGGAGVPHRVDIVRPFLEGLHRQAALGEGGGHP